MKKADYKTSLCQAFTALAFIGTLSACVEEDVADNVWKPKGEELVVLPAVSESPVQRVATRAASVEELKEKELNTLDVFVQRVGENTFMKQYHLPLLADQNIVESNLNWLADRWRKEGLVMGERYNIYVAANTPKTNTDVDGVDALKALAYSEVEDNVAVVNETSNNITWGTDGTSGNIYKLYAETPGDYRALTSEKQFMMDGVINNWTPNPSTLTQEFDVTLNRAAAKIVVNVNFDADFLKSLTKDKDGKEKADKDKLFITGSPAWRFYNFAFGAPVFDPGTNFTPVEVHNSDFNIFHNQPFEGDDMHFQIVTYTYPNKWDEANYATAAPSLVISVPFSQYKNIGADGHHTDDEMTTTYNYFRIPIVAHTTTSVDRNHIYVVNATLATRGSMSLEDEDVIEDVVYNVLPWNDESNSAVIKNEVEPIQHLYLKVNPKVYTLRGDGEQSVVINYLKAAGTKVNWKLFTYDENGNQTGVVAHDAAGATRAWFYNASGAFTTRYSDSGSGVLWGNTMGVDIQQSGEGASGSSGTFTVTSQALTNKAIKYIRFRVYLEESESLYEDVIIRHFPTDNIQNIPGSWSSYHDTSSSTTNVTLKTRTLSEAESWKAQFGIDYTTSQVEVSDVITRRINAQDFRDAVTSLQDRSRANSRENAILVNGTYYWGTDLVNGNRNNYDFYTSNIFGTTYYRYSNYYSETNGPTYTVTEYSITVPMASTGSWVDWNNRGSHSPARTYATTYHYWYNGYDYTNYNGYDGGTFYAKVYDSTNKIIARITENGNNPYTTVQGNNTALTNNHMYVIQISSTSDKYVLGRPYVNQSTHLSQDDVVSPAFMIASQLGAVTPFVGQRGAANAAEHCAHYLEVAENGTRYTGWRLPTEKEIEVITGYQYGNIGGVAIAEDYRVLTEVLGGYYYWSLSGKEKLANDGTHGSDYGSTDPAYLRCVRDLSAEEVDRLNGFDKIVEKYQNK